MKIDGKVLKPNNAPEKYRDVAVTAVRRVPSVYGTGLLCLVKQRTLMHQLCFLSLQWRGRLAYWQRVGPVRVVVPRRARLVLGWVTICRRINQPNTSHAGRLKAFFPSVGKINERQHSVVISKANGRCENEKPLGPSSSAWSKGRRRSALFLHS